MIDYEAIRLREIAMLDQLEAHMLTMLAEARTERERRAIRRRLPRLAYVRSLWKAPLTQRRVATDG